MSWWLGFRLILDLRELGRSRANPMFARLSSKLRHLPRAGTVLRTYCWDKTRWKSRGCGSACITTQTAMAGGEPLSMPSAEPISLCGTCVERSSVSQFASCWEDKRDPVCALTRVIFLELLLRKLTSLPSKQSTSVSPL